MAIDRMKRVNELIRREIGQAIYKIISADEVDLAAVMVSHVDTARNLRTSRVSISIRDHEEDCDKYISVFRRHRVEFQQHLNKVLNMKYTPKLIFRLDESIAKGDHVLDLIYKLQDDIPGATELNVPEGDANDES